MLNSTVHDTLHSGQWSISVHGVLQSTVQSDPQSTLLCSRTTQLDGPLQSKVHSGPLQFTVHFSPRSTLVHGALWSTLVYGRLQFMVNSSARSRPQSISVHDLPRFMAQSSPQSISLDQNVRYVPHWTRMCYTHSTPVQG